MKRIQLAVLAALLLVLAVLISSRPVPSTPQAPEAPPPRFATARSLKLCGYEVGNKLDTTEVVLTQSGSQRDSHWRPTQPERSALSEAAHLPATLVTFQSPPGRVPSNDLPVRLPPVDSPAGNETGHLVKPRAPQGEFADLLRHAAGALEVEIPAGWQVFESTAGRQVYAVLLPRESKASVAYRSDGMWFSHVALPPTDSWNEQQMQQELIRRLSNLPGKPVIVKTNPPASIGPWPASSVVYTLSEPDYTLTASEPFDDIVGALMIVRTAWGLVEVNAVAPRAAYESRQSAYEQILRTMKLAAPAAPSPQSAAMASAGKLLGSWKSPQARVRLYGDSRFELILDPKQPVQIYPPLPPEQRPVVNRVAGEFELSDDVLFVTWNDGTFSNYRWSLNEGELLLTDHEGRISRLAKLYE